MRLLFATTFGHLPELVGGLQTTIDELAQALQARSIEVALVCSALDEDGGVPRSDRSCGYQVVRAADPVVALPAVAAALRPDVIVVQTGPRLIQLVIAARDTGRPTAVYFHNVEPGELHGILVPDPRVLFLANSRFTAARWHAACGIDCEVVLPYVDHAAYRTETTRERILFVNPTMPKGVEIFFRIAAARPALPFSVAESWALDPVWRRHCQARAARLGNIEWLAPTRDMRALYGRARLLLMPSVWEESYGRTIVEAQLNGIPVVASTRGNLADTVGAGGLTVDAHAPLETWLAALDALWREAATDGPRSAAARAHACRPEADPQRVLARFVELVTAHAARRAA